MIFKITSAFMRQFRDPDKRKVLTNFFFLGAERIVQLIVIILINRMIIGSYHLDDFSNWQYSLVVMTVFMTGTWICGSEVVIPRLMDHPERLNLTMSNVITLRFLAGLLIGFLMLMWGMFFAHGLARLFIIGLSISVALRETMIVGLTWFQSEAKLKIPCLILMLSALVKLLVIYIGVHNHVAIQYLWVAWVIESLLPCILIFYIFKHGTSFNFVKVNNEIKTLFKAGLIVWFCLVMQQLTMKFDRIYLDGRVSGEFYSNYASALQLVDNWYSICILFVQAIAPVFIFRYVKIDDIKRKLPFCIFSTLGMTCAGALFTTIFSNEFISLFYGGKLLFSGGYLAHFIWLTPILATDQLLSLVLIRIQKTQRIAIKWLIAFVLTIILIPLAYYVLGVNGILFALLSIYTFNVLFSLWNINHAH
ncbi:polysaccharide transporter, PST family [Ewingella americana]